MGNRYVLLRDRFPVSHIPDPKDDTSTLCGDPTDSMEAVELSDDYPVKVCGRCLRKAAS